MKLIVQEVSCEYNKPTILLTTVECKENKQQNLNFSKGYAYSSNNISSYELISSQHDLLYSFYGEEYSDLVDLSLSNDLAISFLTRNDPDTTDCTPNILIINPISSFIPPST